MSQIPLYILAVEKSLNDNGCIIPVSTKHLNWATGDEDDGQVAFSICFNGRPLVEAFELHEEGEALFEEHFINSVAHLDEIEELINAAHKAMENILFFNRIIDANGDLKRNFIFKDEK